MFSFSSFFSPFFLLPFAQPCSPLAGRRLRSSPNAPRGLRTPPEAAEGRRRPPTALAMSANDPRRGAARRSRSRSGSRTPSCFFARVSQTDAANMNFRSSARRSRVGAGPPGVPQRRLWLRPVRTESSADRRFPCGSPKFMFFGLIVSSSCCRYVLPPALCSSTGPMCAHMHLHEVLAPVEPNVRMGPTWPDLMLIAARPNVRRVYTPCIYLSASPIPPARIAPSLAFGPFGALFEVLWGPLWRPLGVLLGPLGGLLGASWGLLGASWGLLGSSWGRGLEMSLRVPRLGSLLGSSWGHLGTSWKPIGPSRGPL